MVHRPADSRLLTNLLTHEKDYSKHLLALLDYSHASLASFEAYASASSPPSSHAILAVSRFLAGADEALRRYAESVENWQDQLKDLKDLEEDVGNVMRDREILVTRLIKASKAQKPNRESLVVSPSHMSSNSTASLPLSVTSNPSSKLTNAQAQLQACEAHLAAKERELDERRVGAVREGLSVRCEAMVLCGRAWGEMGKEGLRALESMANGHLSPPSQVSPSSSQVHQPLIHQYQKPLPDPTQPPSDLSTANSLEPSHSASQINLPAAYRIDDYTFPTGSSSGHGHNENGRHQLSRRITEEEDEGDSSTEDIGPVQVVENARFASTSSFSGALGGKGKTGGVGRRFSIRGGRKTNSDVGPSYQPPDSPVAEYGGSKRERKGSFFGSIRGLFKGKDKKDGSEAGSEASYPSLGGGETIGKGRGKWKTRTDANVKSVSKRGGGGDSDAEDLAGVLSDPGVGIGYGGTSRGRGNRLSKKASVGKGVGAEGVRRAEEWIGGQNSYAERENERWGTTPTPAGEGEGGTIKAKRRRKRKGSPMRENTMANGEFSASGFQAVTLSRNSSLMSAASAPPASRSPTSTTISPIGGTAKSQPPRRSSSMRVSGTPGAGTKTKKRASLSVHTPHGMGEGTASLMSIVEGVTKANREARASSEALVSSLHAPGGLKETGKTNDWKGSTKMGSLSSGLQVAKAPPPISIQQLSDDGGLPLVTVSAAPLELARAPRSVFSSSGLVSASSGSLSRGGDERTRKSSLPTPVPSSRTGLPASSSSTSMRPGMPASRSSMDDAIGLRATRPAKSPLRSALRTSRSPSPLPGTSTAPPLNSVSQSTSIATTGSTPGSNSIIPNGVSKEDDDNSSVSSYETGHETLNAEDFGGEYNQQKDQPPPPPPPHDKEDSDLSGASTSTPTYPTNATSNSNSTTNPQRRKSVRVSLQPTFSPTPPAFDDYDGGYTWQSGDGWGKSQNKGGKGEEVAVRDMWEDSSEEDEEYARARRLLGRAARKSQEKGKSRARP